MLHRVIISVVFTLMSSAILSFQSDSIKLKRDSSLLLKEIIEGKISPKSIVHSGNGLFFAQNMMYRHTITVYNRSFELIKTITDKVRLKDYGFEIYEGQYRGAPVECAFSHDGKYAWVSNYNMSGGEETEFINPGCDNCRGTGVYDSSYVYKINTENLNIEEVIQVGAVPKYVAVTPGNKYVLVTNWSSSDVSVIDVELNKEVERIKLGAYPRGIVISKDGSKAYIAIMGSSKIAVLNLGDFSKTWIEHVGKSPRHLCLSPDNDVLYASINGEGVIAKIDLNNQQVDKVKTGRLPRSMVLSSDGNFLYVVNYGSDNVAKIRAEDMAVVDYIETNDKPIGITYDSQEHNVWVACYEGSIMVFHDRFYDQPMVVQVGSELNYREKGDFGNEQRKANLKNYLENKEKVVEEEPEVAQVVVPQPVKVESNQQEVFLLVAGSFKNVSNAKKLVSDLKKQGYEALEFYNQQNGNTYACAGQFENREDAISMLEKLELEGVEVWLYKKK